MLLVLLDLHTSFPVSSSVPCLQAQVSELSSAIIRSHKILFYLRCRDDMPMCDANVFDHLKGIEIKDRSVHGGIVCVYSELCADTDRYILCKYLSFWGSFTGNTSIA